MQLRISATTITGNRLLRISSSLLVYEVNSKGPGLIESVFYLTGLYIFHRDWVNDQLIY